MSTTEQVLRMKAAFFADLNAVRVTADESAKSCIDSVRDREDHTVWVVDDDNRLLGIITDVDLLNALADSELAEKVRSGEATARDLMVPLDPAQTDTVARADDPLGNVIYRLKGENREGQSLKVMPVVDQHGTVRGQITRKDIRRNLDEMLQ